MKRRNALALTLLASAPWPEAAWCGQEPLERAVGGVVVDSVSGRPLSGVSAYLTTAPGEVRSRPDGSFVLRRGTTRDTVLVLRRIGYVPRTFILPPLETSATNLYVGSLAMRPVATELDRLTVEAEEIRRYPQLTGFYQRKRTLTGQGQFFTREDIERTAAVRTSDVLRRSEKIVVECDRRMVGDVGSCNAASRRGRETRLRPNAPTARDFQNPAEMARCRMEVWVDGVRSHFDVDATPVDWIVGIEVYSGAATAPPIFGQAPCGVVAVWTWVTG